MRTSRLLGALLLAALALSAVEALAVDSKAGTSGAQFLKLGAGARAGAMAETQVAVADDAYAAYYNPAGLTWTTRPMAAGMHDAYFQSISYDYVGFSYPFQVKGDRARHAMAVSVSNLSANGIDRRTDDTDIATGQFGVSDSAYAVSYAYRPIDRLSTGATLKLVRSKLDSVSAQAEALDAGALYRFGDTRTLDVGVVVRNAGTGLKWSQGTDPLPFTTGAGVALRPLKGLVLAADLMKSRDTAAYYNLGVEYRASVTPQFSAAVRGGYTTHFKDAADIKGWTAGFGLAFNRVAFDLAWIPFGDLGTTFKYSLLVRF